MTNEQIEQIKNDVKNKQTLASKLNIDIERSMFLINACKQKLQSKREINTVDVMWEMRNEHSQNASEDMLICYTIGSLSVLLAHPIIPILISTMKK